MSASEQVAKALGVAAEVIGQELSQTAVLVMAEDLAGFPESAVLSAIQRTRKECTRLVLAHIIERIDDGRPGPEEAWQMIPRDEASSVVWTDEMAEASGGIDLGDKVAARVAFLERYRSLVSRARNDGVPVKWWPSLGHDPAGRATVIREAVERGRLSYDRGRQLVPALEAPSGDVMGLIQDLADGMRMTRVNRDAGVSE